LLLWGVSRAAELAEWLYEEALTAAAAADTPRARALLLEVVRQEPRHAGAWLDLALLSCSAGDTAEAHGVLRRILAEFDPPAAIRTLVLAQLAQPCLPLAAPLLPATAWRFGAARGHDTNVNSGTLASHLVLGTGTEAIRLPLAPELRPRSDRFDEFWADLATRTQWVGRSAILKLGVLARRYAREADYDLQGVTAAAELPAGSGAWAGRVQLTGMASWLGNTHFMDSLAVGWLGGLPLTAGGLPMHHEWSLMRVRFANNPAFDSVSLTARAGVSGRHAGWFWRANALAAIESADGRRPGGDRYGGGAELLAQRQLAPTVRLEVQARALQMQSRSAYLPPLLAVRREQALFSGRADIAVALEGGYEWVTSWQAQDSRDNLGFLAYRGQSLQTGIVARF